MDKDYSSKSDKIIQLNENTVKNILGQIVRSAVGQTLNEMLDAKADQLCNAEKYRRSDARTDTRAGHYERNLQTQAGEVRPKVPKLRCQTSEAAIGHRQQTSAMNREQGQTDPHRVPRFFRTRSP